MKNYEKKYEDVYTSERRLKSCDIEQVTTDIGLDGREFAAFMKKECLALEKNIFDILIKYHWMVRRFRYSGKERKLNKINGWYLEKAFGIFMSHHVNIDKMSFGGKSLSTIVSYFYDFFPDFDLMDPFKDDMPYPYKNIGLSHLRLVRNLPERLELLSYADRNNIGYTEFLDYIINYIYCHNDEVGWNEYEASLDMYFNVPRIVVRKKDEGRKKTKARRISKG